MECEQLADHTVTDCLKNEDRFVVVGYPELGRNKVFYDKKAKSYLKFYGNRSHFQNEKTALCYYEDYEIVPPIKYAHEMCIEIEQLCGTTMNANMLSVTHYAHMGKALKELHEFSLKKEKMRPSISYKDYYCEEQNKWNRLCKRLESSEFSLWKPTISEAEELLHNFNYNEWDQVVLCHNDYCPRNVLFDSDSVSGIIDFEKSRFADPACDFATIIIKEFYTDKLAYFIKAYEAVISDDARNRLLYFSLYKALEVLTWAKNVAQTYYNSAIMFLRQWKRLYEFF